MKTTTSYYQSIVFTFSSFNFQVSSFDRVIKLLRLKKILKNQNDVVLKKNQRLATGFLTGSLVNPSGQPGHTGFFLPLFFSQPNSVPAPDWPSSESTC